MNYWGRIFFLYAENEALDSVSGQPLDNHTTNCRHILEQFHASYFHPDTRSKLMQAVDLHDEGKKETFRIVEVETEATPDSKRRFGYSFAGHRFRVLCSDPYISGLIRSHHEFSVEQVNRERARLSGRERLFFADDLYLLCMADQLEAELAVKSVEGKETVPRTFMEFTTSPWEDTPDTFTVTPWPFAADCFDLEFELKDLDLDKVGSTTSELENALKSRSELGTRKIRTTVRRM